MNLKSSKSSSRDSARTTTSSGMEFGDLSSAGQWQSGKTESKSHYEQVLQQSPTQMTLDHHDVVPSPNPMIDPAIMGPNSPSIYNEGIYLSGRPEQQYAQSYERYRSLTPSTSISAQPPALSRIRQAHGIEDAVSSPTESSVRSPMSTFSNQGSLIPSFDSPTTTPPFIGNSSADGEVPDINSSRPFKRTRYQPGPDASSPPLDTTMPPPNTAPYTPYTGESQVSNVIVIAPSSTSTPLTPASSYSDEVYKVHSSKLSPQPPLDSPDLRRLSVNSLLSGPPGPGLPSANDRAYVDSNNGVQDWSLQPNDVYQDTTTYGIDRGIKDLDIGKNDDMNAISGASPIALRDHLDLVLDEDGQFSPIEFGFGMEIEPTAFENGAYYDKPVPICIPRILEPLPIKLLENPMNLLVNFSTYSKR
jgi:hypothetical protein